jgi:transcriptional regulator with XRE-family HTH domain
MRRIGRQKPRRVYIREWRESRGLTQQQLAERLDTDSGTVSRYETGKRRLDAPIMNDIAFALDVDVPDLYRHPDQPSADALLRGAPQHVVESTIAFIQTLRRAGS